MGKWHVKFETKFLQLKNTAVLNKEREKNMKNFLRNMAALIIAVAMVAIFVAVVWMNRWFLIKRAIIILASTAAIAGMVTLLLHLSNKKDK